MQDGESMQFLLRLAHQREVMLEIAFAACLATAGAVILSGVSAEAIIVAICPPWERNVACSVADEHFCF